MGDAELEYLIRAYMQMGMTVEEAMQAVQMMEQTDSWASEPPPDNLQPIGMDNAQDLEDELNRFTGDGPSFDPSPQEGDLLGGLGPMTFSFSSWKKR
jgi:hypothetical protein